VAGGDLVVAVDGAPIAAVEDLQAALAAATGPVELVVVRGTDERTVTVDVLAGAA
jgi:S1-C subfamily serine protease